MIQDVSNGVYARPEYKDATYFKGFFFVGNEGNYPVYVWMMDPSKTTRDIRQALICTLEQAKNVRRIYPNTKSMRLVRNSLPNRPPRG